jgi:phosphoribosylaminoimidazole-succinocarboxamide synthase
MAHIPITILEQDPPLSGLTLENQGKVRDTHSLSGRNDLMLVRATKRVSAFDFVLPALILLKGEILTAMNHFWVTQVLGSFFKTDLVACGAEIDAFLEERYRGNVDLQKSGTIVKRFTSPKKEDIIRFALTGSALKDYLRTGEVCGHRLSPGLIDGNMLPTPLYTPSTKAAVGHDMNISVYDIIAEYGPKQEHWLLMMAGMMHQYARSKGILLADMKVETYEDILIDEKGTPDCCRFWDIIAWEKAQAKRKLPPSLDKQFVREECKRLGIDKLDPKNSADLAIVDKLTFDEHVCHMTTRIYRYIFWRLTGMQIEVYQHAKMGIDVRARRPKIEILLGSESDLPQIEDGLSYLRNNADFRVHVISCHRNPDLLRQFAENRQDGADLVIAGAGKSAQLPGVLKSWLCYYKRPEIPVVGVAFESKSEQADRAAIDAIEELPSQPVELDPAGHAYFGSKGFYDACVAAVEHEFLPKAFEPKPAKFNICQNS